MPFYWMERRIPEREALRARGRVSEWKMCRMRIFLDWRFWPGVGAALALAAVGLFVAREIGGDTATTVSLTGLGAVVGSLVLRQIALALTRAQARMLLMKEVRGRAEGDERRVS